jgi:hypothetical protein
MDREKRALRVTGHQVVPEEISNFCVRHENSPLDSEFDITDDAGGDFPGCLLLCNIRWREIILPPAKSRANR